jgi:MFS family permease
VTLPPVLRHRDFNVYWFGVVVSEIGTRGTIAACLFQVYSLSRSLPMTGLVGLAQAVALLILGPLGGAYADRLDRRTVLQCAQATSMLVALGLMIVTFSGHIRVWHVLVCVVLTTAAATFDSPSRVALIPAMVPPGELAQAFALINPTREVAVLIGPALAGVLIATGSPGLMYAVDVATYATLVVALWLVRIPHQVPEASSNSVWSNIREGAAFLRHRRLLVQLISLDLSATLFGAYRVVLPALALDVLHVGPQGFGLLAAAPSAGALLATWVVFRVMGGATAVGRLLLWSTVGYGVAVLVLAQSRDLALALIAGGVLGAFDAMTTTIRQAAIQLGTPDHLRGRVSSIYQMASKGGPSLGGLNMGWIAGLLGPALGLTLGGLVTISYASAFLLRGGVVRDHVLGVPAHDDETGPGR